MRDSGNVSRAVDERKMTVDDAWIRVQCSKLGKKTEGRMLLWTIDNRQYELYRFQNRIPDTSERVKLLSGNDIVESKVTADAQFLGQLFWYKSLLGGHFEEFKLICVAADSSPYSSIVYRDYRIELVKTPADIFEDDWEPNVYSEMW